MWNYKELINKAELRIADFKQKKQIEDNKPSIISYQHFTPTWLNEQIIRAINLNIYIRNRYNKTCFPKIESDYVTIINGVVGIRDSFLKEVIWNSLQENNYEYVDVDLEVETNLITKDPVYLIIEGKLSENDLIIDLAKICAPEDEYFFEVPFSVVKKIENDYLFNKKIDNL